MLVGAINIFADLVLCYFYRLFFSLDPFERDLDPCRKWNLLKLHWPKYLKEQNEQVHRLGQDDY